MTKHSLLLIALTFVSKIAFAQYQPNQAEFGIFQFEKEKYGVVKMSNKNNSLKVKYFAFKYNNKTISKRYHEWQLNKNIICFSSAAYMDGPNEKIAKPKGLCIDQGRIINNNLIKGELDGLVMVYPSGKMAVHNLKNGSIQYDKGDGKQSKVDPSNIFQMTRFIEWAKEQEITIFQTHLFYHKNQNLIVQSNGKLAARRFLAVGKDETGELKYYIINAKQRLTLSAAAEKTVRYLRSFENLSSIEYLINLDTGGQDIFSVNDNTGRKTNYPELKGETEINLAVNLIVFSVD